MAQSHIVSRAGLFVMLLAICLVHVAGCKRGNATAQVRGKVLYPDGSVPKGGIRVVRFEPANDSTATIRKGASGQIRSDGSFEMATRVPGDGVYLGKYAVTFAIWKGPRDPTSLIVDKYTNASTTPYFVTVDGDINDLSFQIEPIKTNGNTGTASND